MRVNGYSPSAMRVIWSHVAGGLKCDQGWSGDQGWPCVAHCQVLHWVFRLAGLPSSLFGVSPWTWAVGHPAVSWYGSEAVPLEHWGCPLIPWYSSCGICFGGTCLHFQFQWCTIFHQAVIWPLLSPRSSFRPQRASSSLCPHWLVVLALWQTCCSVVLAFPFTSWGQLFPCQVPLNAVSAALLWLEEEALFAYSSTAERGLTPSPVFWWSTM